MEKRGASILLMLLLEALLVVAGISAVAVSGGVDTIRLPSDAETEVPATKERPWECCDIAICTRSWPPFCHCNDQVEQCSNACKECVEVEGSNPLRYICKDIYHGFPGPQCTEDQANHVEHNRLADQESVVAVEGEASGGKKDGEEERPWECCDKGICATSFPPMCRCFDEVERCSNACKQCEELVGSKPPRYVCKDVYRGNNPAPPCKKDDRENHGADQDSAVAVKEEVSKGKKDDHEERPWLCCDLPFCTRSFPPICRCMDQVKFCFHTCKQCEQVEGSNPTLYMCKDVYRGFPGPQCLKDEENHGNVVHGV